MRGPGPGFTNEERKIVKQFDADDDGRLDKTERAAAREFLKKNPAPRRAFGPRGGGGPGGRDGRPTADGPREGGRPPGDDFPAPPPGFGREENTEPPKPGPRIFPDQVRPAEGRDLYAVNVLRTLFFDFENEDWESELSDFHGTDVEVPATLTVDGVKYPGVGVRFRGMSSYMMVRAGQKRSLNVSLDFTEKQQRLEGYKSLNLLNGHEDDSFMSPVLYSHVARQYIAAPKANFVRVVVNGECWGVYVNAQQFNKDFVQENFREQKGARWKVPGSPMAQGGLDYIGDNIAHYKRHYEIKSGDDDDWRALITLCKTLSQTPVDQLEQALAPMLDLDSVLWFLALDCALINGDGYWVRASDYSLYRDKKGKFHVIPSDMNESFRASGGPGGPGMRRMFGRPPEGGEAPVPPPAGDAALRGPASAPVPVASANAEAKPDAPRPERMSFPPVARVDGVKLDPLHGMDDARKPLRSRLLAVPSLRQRYLGHIHTIADEWLDWKKLGPLVAQYRALIEKEVEADTRKLTTLASFQRATADTLPEPEKDPEANAPRRRRESSLRKFAEDRRAYLLGIPEVVAAAKK